MADSNTHITNLVSNFLSGTPSTGETATHESEGVVFSDNSTQSEALADYGTEAKDSESQTDVDPITGETPTGSETKDQPKVASGDKETIVVTDDKGKRKIEIDYSNREAIKKAFQLQYGARKWQAERDREIESKKSIEAELGKVKQDWETLDKAYQQGPEHLFDLLQGRKGAFKEHVRKEREREEFLKYATPEEIRSMELKEMNERKERELDEIRKENEKFKQAMVSEREQAEIRSMESQVHPVFNKYRFAETLGNADDEQVFDEMLWNSGIQRLTAYEEKGIPITRELVDREFKAVAGTIRKRIGTQAEKKATRVVEQKKREATENVQAKVMSGYKTGGTAKEARDLLNKGDLTSLLKGWGKYGGLFNK